MASRPDALRIHLIHGTAHAAPFLRAAAADVPASFFSHWKKPQRLMMDLNPLASSCWRAADAVWLSGYGPTCTR